MTPTPDQQRISAQYLAGAAPSELARTRRCSLAEIEAALTATNTPRRKRGGNRLGVYQSRAEAMDAIAARNAEIIRLAAAGTTTTEIMQITGLQRAAVCKVLRQAHGKQPVASDAEIIALRQAGASISTIIQDLHVSHRRATRALAGTGMLPTAPDLAARTAEILRRRRAGEHPKAIAAALGIGETTVYRALLGATDLPPLHQGARARAAKKPKTPKPSTLPMIVTPPTDRQPPALLERPHRPPAQRRPAIRRAEGVVAATRTCHSCEIQIRTTEWSKHLAEAHGYTSKSTQARTALDRYIAQIAAAPEPQRPPDPPCEVCGASPCPTPLSHGRIARARRQHHYQPRSSR